ncbi:MAG: D-amino-acid transaminase [Parvibaculaceae bacterium]|nr:D-amino-acid transaminase [Parvibaculaceae bacterium]
MSRIAYVNGHYGPHNAAAVHIEDRGYQFADAVYEVCGIRGGKMLDEDAHLNRLDWSLGELQIPWPMARAALQMTMREVIRRNRVKHGMVYLQVSRGRARRTHAFPKHMTPSLVITATSTPRPPNAQSFPAAVSVITQPDIRWQRVDIKTVSLLPNSLARHAAGEAGSREAWLVDENGKVTEGSSSNAWIVDQQNRVHTHPINGRILNGTVRQALIALAKKEGIEVIEAPFTCQEAYAAKEAFLTSSNALVQPIDQIDGHQIGNGSESEISQQLWRAYYIENQIAP